MNLTKQEVLKLIQDIPDTDFDVHQVIDELAYRLTLQQRLEDAERGENCLTDEAVQQRFGRWLSD
jgi:hypothetical protein